MVRVPLPVVSGLHGNNGIHRCWSLCSINYKEASCSIDWFVQSGCWHSVHVCCVSAWGTGVVDPKCDATGSTDGVRSSLAIFSFRHPGEELPVAASVLGWRCYCSVIQDVKKTLLCFVSKLMKNVSERLFHSGFGSSRNNCLWLKSAWLSCCLWGLVGSSNWEQ